MPFDPPRSDDPDGVGQLRAAFDAAGYDTDAIVRALGLPGVDERSPGDVALHARLLPAGTAFATLVRLFLLGLPVARTEAEHALAPLDLERAKRIGLVELGADWVRALVEISPSEEFLLACDQRKSDADIADHVLGYSGATRVLAALTVLEPVDVVLDVGTGSGFQALQAAAVARHVVGVDVNRRALEFARFNALLNSVPNVEFREGDLFEPVGDASFGLVVCNPPYVVSPSTEYLFRDSGHPGDSFCEAVVREIPAHLVEGGFGVVLIAWVHRRDEDPNVRVRSWLEGSGCDALLFRYTTTDPLRYAATWSLGLGNTPHAHATTIDEWTAYYRSLEIEAISTGAVVLRRRSSGGENWFWMHSPSSNRLGAAGDQVLRLFAGQDLLRGNGDGRGLLARRLALATDHRFEQTGRIGGPTGEAGDAVLRLDGGLCFRAEVDAATVGLLALLDGGRTLAEAVRELARQTDEPGEATLAEAALPGVRRLVELGFLVEAAA